MDGIWLNQKGQEAGGDMRDPLSENRPPECGNRSDSELPPKVRQTFYKKQQKSKRKKIEVELYYGLRDQLKLGSKPTSSQPLDLPIFIIN